MFGGSVLLNTRENTIAFLTCLWALASVKTRWTFWSGLVRHLVCVLRVIHGGGGVSPSVAICHDS